MAYSIVTLLSLWMVEVSKVEINIPALTSRQHAAKSLFMLCREHCKSVEMLLAKGEGRQLSSALALLRPALDALLRGCWVAKCMDDQSFEPYLKEETASWPGKNDLFRELKPVLSPGVWRVLSEHSGLMNGDYHDFTHGGVQQILRYMRPDPSTRGAATHGELKFVVSKVLSYDIYAAEFLCDLVGDQDALNAVHLTSHRLDLNSAFEDAL